jgi:hypothetical protein
MLIRNAASLFALSALLATPANAQGVPTSRNCRAVSLLLCAPDFCETRELPGATPADGGGWVAGSGRPNLATVDYDRAARRLTVCWDRRCWTSNAAATWTSAAAYGATGAMTNRFIATPEASRFRIVFDVRGHDLSFSLVAYPGDSDYWVVTGDCAAAATRRR